jgi:hypothetical protein
MTMKNAPSKRGPKADTVNIEGGWKSGKALAKKRRARRAAPEKKRARPKRAQAGS